VPKATIYISALNLIQAFIQVPVLAHPTLLSKPMPESLDITYYIAKHYPSLLPSSHKEEITALLAGLHDLNFFALSFGDEPVPATAKKAAIQEKLSRPGISERYRKALEDKKETM
jgi:glutathione S-transferase